MTVSDDGNNFYDHGWTYLAKNIHIFNLLKLFTFSQTIKIRADKGLMHETSVFQIVVI